jgi:hypothetical protein
MTATLAAIVVVRVWMVAAPAAATATAAATAVVL